MDKPMSNLHFRIMTWMFKFRDLVVSPRSKLREAGIQQGYHVLDYGCGPGSYSSAAAELVGKTGKVYALDIHPLAIQEAKKAASKKGITNIETICTDCPTPLENESIDIVLLYDTFHDLHDPDNVMKELHRIMRPKSILSFSDHHMKKEEILSKVTNDGLFRLARQGKRTYSFSREELKKENGKET